MSDTRVKVHAEGPVMVITFDHPPAHAVNQKFSQDLTAAIQRLEDDPTCAAPSSRRPGTACSARAGI